MRENEAAVAASHESLKRPLKATFLALPSSKPKGELCSQYLVLVECLDLEMIRLVYIVGERVTVTFQKPEEDKKPEGWSPEIKPPIPGILCPGNLILQMFHPKGNTDVIPIKTDFNATTDLDSNVWLFPEVSDLAVRRIVNCANLLFDREETKHFFADNQRYAVGRDLRENKTGHGFFNNVDLEANDEIQEIISKWDPSQKKTFEEIKKTKRPFFYLHGPPGCGKTRFCKDLCRTFNLIHHKVLMTASSNAAVDNFAISMEESYPQAGAMRFHS